MWQPVPVISIPREHDTLIIQRRNCPRYDVEMKRQLQSEAIRTYEESNLELYEFLTSKSGVNISTFAGVDFLHNSLVAMETAGWKLPEWTREVYPKKTFAICLRYLKFLTETKFMKLTRGGPLLTEIANSMSLKSDKIVGLISPNISIYSGHDVTLVNLMSVLNVANQLEQEPKYAATLAVELYGGSDDDVNVRVLYFLDETDANPRELTMPDCASPCNLRRFMEVNQEYFVTDYDKMCREVESQGWTCCKKVKILPNVDLNRFFANRAICFSGYMWNSIERWTNKIFLYFEFSSWFYSKLFLTDFDTWASICWLIFDLTSSLDFFSVVFFPLHNSLNFFLISGEKKRANYDSISWEENNFVLIS